MAIAATSAIVGTGLSVAGAAGAFAPGSPGSVPFGETEAQYLHDIINLTPQVLQARGQYDPSNLAINQNLAWDQLFGTPGGSRTETYSNPIEYGLKEYQQIYNQRFAPSGPNVTQAEQQAFLQKLQNMTPDQLKQALGGPLYHSNSSTRTVNTPAGKGQLELLGAAQPFMNALQSSQRGANIADVEKLAPAARQALMDANPGASNLLTTLTGQAQEQLDQNGRLDPFTQRQLGQNIRGAQSARGVGTGANDAAAEGYYQTQGMEQRRQQAQQLAAGTVTANSAYYGDPFSQILGYSSGRTQVPTSFTGASVVPSGMDVSGLAMQGAGQQYNAQQNVNRAGYNSQMQGIGAIPGAINNLGTVNWSSIFGGGGTGGYNGSTNF